MSQLSLFARLAKVDEAKRQVTGIIASETPDAANEIFDYDTSKANFESWSQNVAKASGGKSVGNLRAMHGSVVAGTIEEIVFDDVAKTISVTANVVDDNEWNKCLKGAYTGFSIGGKYVRKWADAANKMFKRYTAAPSEVSLVDVGCNFDASFTLCKADGMETEVKFEDTAHGILSKMADPETNPADLPALSEKLAKAFGHVVNPVVGEPDEEELAKSAWSIETLARCADNAEMIATCYGVNIDGTVRAFGDDVKKAANLLLDALVKMVGEDVAAAKERLKGIKKQLDDADGEVLAKRTVISEAFGEEPLNVTVIEDLGKFVGVAADAEKLMKFVSDNDELKKSLTTANEELVSVKAELEKVKGEPAPAKGVKALVVGKEEDGLTKSADSGNAQAATETDPVALMKQAHTAPRPIGLPHRFTNQNGG